MHRSNLTVFEIDEIRQRHLETISIMENTCYPGGHENRIEKATQSNTDQEVQSLEPASKRARVNRYETTSYVSLSSSVI